MLAGLKKLVAPLLGRGDSGSGGSAEVSPTAMRLTALFDERRRIGRLADAEDERAAALAQRLEAAEAARIAALTTARLNGLEDPSQGADELNAQSEAIRREIADAGAVARNLRAALAGLMEQSDGLKASYRMEVDAFLTSLYARSMQRYNELAPEVAATVLQVAAIRRVMIAQRCGNSNGWSGEVLLPGMKPRVGAMIPPILAAGTKEFDEAATRAQGEVMEAVREAGFLYEIDWK